MDEVKKRFLAFSSHVICFGMALNLSYIFLCAYLNGYHVNVYVNNHGEALFELVLFPITLLFCIVGLWYTWHFFKKAMMGGNEMSLLERLKARKQKMLDQMNRGRVVTEQKHAERMRKKSEKAKYYEPGTIRYGLAHKQNPLDLMKDVKQRRKEKRKHR